MREPTVAYHVVGVHEAKFDASGALSRCESYVIGLPTGQAAGSAKFLAKVAAEDEDPQTVADCFRKLVYWPAPKHPTR